ncbi:hypothetical protein THAOC_10524, partial [Thalassiosira oceanica]
MGRRCWAKAKLMEERHGGRNANAGDWSGACARTSVESRPRGRAYRPPRRPLPVVIDHPQQDALTGHGETVDRGG